MSQQWYYRFLDQDIGPVAFETLRGLAAGGSLDANDLVRKDTDNEWRTVESVGGILPDDADADDLEQMLSDAPGEADLDAMMPDVPDLDSMLAPSAPSTESNSRSASRGDCYCRLLGQELGPMPLEELIHLAEDGELSATDEVKIGGESEWVPAESVVGLIPKAKPKRKKSSKKNRRRVSEAEIDAILQNQEYEAGGTSNAAPAYVAHQRLAKLPPRSAAEGKRSAGPSSTVEPDSKEIIPAQESEKQAPDAEAPALEGRDEPAPPAPKRREPVAASAARSLAASPPPRPAAPAPRPKKPRSNPFAGLGSGASSLLGGLRGKGKPIALAVGLVAVLGLVVFGGSFLGAGRGSNVYAETLAIWEEAGRLRSSDAGPDQWKAFAERVGPRVDQLADELEQEASAKKRLLQLMLYCHRDCLPKILDHGGDSADAAWEEMEGYMSEAAGIVSK
ncbi:MAG: DUF4339 domain-containing protein [Planctomycetota bacterium]|nr:MAG: DUF4339 domain-containing protein [Planctomycetota bacterium]